MINTVNATQTPTESRNTIRQLIKTLRREGEAAYNDFYIIMFESEAEINHNGDHLLTVCNEEDLIDFLECCHV